MGRKERQEARRKRRERRKQEWKRLNETAKDRDPLTALGRLIAPPEVKVEVKTNYRSSIEAEVEAFLEERVKAGQSTSCVNSVSISNVSGCTIGDIEQMCSAAASGVLVAGETDMVEMQQRTLQRSYEAIMYQQREYFKQAALDLQEYGNELQKEKYEEAMKNANPGETNEFKYSLFVMESAKIAISARTLLETRCSRDASAFNLVELENVTCTGDSEINFARQNSSAEAIGDCVVNPSFGQLAEYLLNQESREAFMTAGNFVAKGSTMYSLAAIIVVALFIMLLVFLWVRWVRIDRRISIPVYVILGLLLLFIIVWWPGIFSYRIGMWPWPIPISQQVDGNGELYCDKETAGIAESGLLTNIRGSQDVDGCPVDTPDCGHYHGCGLFGACDDPRFLGTDKPKWDAIVAACADAPTGGSCDVQTLFDQVFYGDYPGCKPCREQGVYALSEATCFDGTFDLLKYGGFGDIVNTDGTIGANSCPDGDTDCIATEAAYEAASPGECLSTSYHLRKKILVGYFRACQGVRAVAADPDAELVDQCPPMMEDYLDCDASGFCNYAPVDQANAEACLNSYIGCNDPYYLNDLAADAAQEHMCEEAVLLWEQVNSIPFYVTISVYAVMIGVVVALVIYARVKQKGKLNLAPFKLDKVGFLIGFIILFLFMIAMGPPIGFMGAALNMAPFYGEDDKRPFEAENFEPSAPIAISAFVVSVLLWLAWCVYYFVQTRKND